MTVRFGLGEGPTTVNRMAVTFFHCIVTHPFVSLDMFDVLLVHNNYYCLCYQLAATMPFMPMRIYKKA